jgi:hypothetical protein
VTGQISFKLYNQSLDWTLSDQKIGRILVYLYFFQSYNIYGLFTPPNVSANRLAAADCCIHIFSL